MATYTEFVLRVGYNLGYAISATTPVTTTSCVQYLNDAVKEIVEKFHKRQCWKLLHELHKEATYTLTGATSYDVYTVIGDSTDYYAFISDGDGWTASELGVYPLAEVSVRHYNKITSAGEYYPTEARPYICFYEYDTTEAHGNLPKFRIRPSASTETLYFRYLKNPPEISADSTASCLGTICDNMIVNYATAQGWLVERNDKQYDKFNYKFEKELNELVGKYEEPMWTAPRADPIR